VRLVNNQILPGVQHYVAQLTKNKPVINATPDSGSDRDLKAAQMGQALYEWWWVDMALGTKLQSALTHAALSQGYWHISWDDLAGKSMTFMISPEGQPLIGWDDESLDIYRDELTQQGADPKQFEQTVYIGDLGVKVLPGESVLLDPAAATFEDAQYAIVIQNMDPDEVRARYPKAKNLKELPPDAVPGEEAVNLAGIGSGFQDERPKSIRRVYCMYVRPGALAPKGRVVCWIESPDMILVDEPWSFPFTELPLVKFPGIERPDSPLDIPVTTPSRPVQKAINRIISQAEEHRNLTMKPQMLAPIGSLQQRITSEPGAVIPFAPINGMVPEWRNIPNLPSYVFEQLNDYQRRLDMVFNRTPSGRDQLPARIDSGSSIDLIQEAVSDQISPVIQRMESALVRAGKLMVNLAQKHYTEQRFMKIKGANGSTQVKKFMNSDLEGGFSFHAEAGSGLPRTRAGKQARVEFMLDKGLIDPRGAMKFLDTADMTGLMAQQQADEDQAYRSIEKLKKGEPLNPQAVAQANQQAQQVIQMIQMGQVPDMDGDGQPDDPNQVIAQLQQQMEQAAVAPQPYEDYETHVNVLRRFMTSVEYEALDPQTQQRFVDRFGAMYDALISLNAMKMEPPKTTLQLKATTSAPVAAKILGRAGVQTTPDEVAEPPLDTWVTDDITAPAVQETGNTHLDEAAKAQALAQSQEEHALKMAKASHEVSLASARANQTHQQVDNAGDSHALDQSRAEELHAEKLRQMRKPAPTPSRG
jgi:negative regulator of replication initiation